MYSLVIGSGGGGSGGDIIIHYTTIPSLPWL